MLEYLRPTLAAWLSPRAAALRPARIASLAALAWVTIYAAWAISLRDRSTGLGIAIDDLLVVPLNLALIVALVRTARGTAPSAAERRAAGWLAGMYACTVVGNVLWYLADARRDPAADYGAASLAYLPCYLFGIAALRAIPVLPVAPEARQRYRRDRGMVALCAAVLILLFTVPHLGDGPVDRWRVALDAAHTAGTVALAVGLARVLLRPLGGEAPRCMRVLAWGMSVQVLYDLTRQMAILGPGWEAPSWLYPLLAIAYAGMIGAAVSMRVPAATASRSAVGEAVRTSSALPVVSVLLTFLALVVGARHHADHLADEWLVLAATILGAAMLAHHRETVVEQARVTTALAAAEAGRRYERRLQEAEKQEALGRMASGVAHDFNNMITAVVANCELAADALPANALAHEELLEIRAAAMRGADLTRQLLIFSRQEQPHARPVDVPALLLDGHRLLQRVAGDRVRVTLDAEPLPGSVVIDRGQLEQVIVNLVANARDAMRGVGHVRIEVTQQVLDGRAALDRHLASGPYVTIRVSDTGSGIAADALPHIFDPFFTTKPVGEGTGLGLATAATTVRAAGGAIEAANLPGTGACITIHLPHSAAEPVPVEVPTRHVAVTPSAGAVILVVEDDATVRQITRLVLARSGFTVLSAASVEDAQRVLRRWHGRLDLVLADVVLPDGTGPGLALDLARRDPYLPVVLMSGYAPDELAQFADVPLEGPLLRKPFTPRAMQEAVEQALKGRRLPPLTMAGGA